MAHERILLVENDLILAWDLTEALEGAGYEVYAVRTATEGACATRSWRPDLAIVDENAASCTQSEAAALRAAVQSAVILLGAGEGLRVDQWASAEVVGKPFVESELLAKVAKELERSRDLSIPCGDTAALVEVFA